MNQQRRDYATPALTGVPVAKDSTVDSTVHDQAEVRARDRPVDLAVIGQRVDVVVGDNALRLAQ